MLLFSVPLALSAPVLEVLETHSIPILSTGALVFLGGMFFASLLMGATAAMLLPSQGAARVRQALYVLALVSILLCVIDVAIGGHKILSVVGANRYVRFAGLAATAALLFAVLWPMRWRAGSIFFVAAAALFVSTVALNWRVPDLAASVDGTGAAQALAPDKPPVLYIVLDGAMGLEGLKRAPGGEPLAGGVRELLLRHGFRVYGSAFSRHFVSARAIPNTLNFDFHDNSWGPKLRHHEGGKVRSRLFEDLANDGYEVVVYGTEHIDFCFDVARRCEVLPSFNPFSPYLEHDERRGRWLYQVLWLSFNRSYLLYRYGQLLLSMTGDEASSPPKDQLLDLRIGDFAALDTYAFPRWFQHFQDDVASSPRGRAYFAHLLMPHAPYIYDPGCREPGTAVVAYFLNEQHNLTGAALDAARATGYEAYVNQYSCLLRKLDEFLAKLDAVETFDDATIVIHGDHGARISAGMYFESLSERDLIDNYSALYAIRGASIPAGYDGRMTSIQRLTAEYFAPGGGTAIGPDDLTVAIDTREGQDVDQRMPILTPPAK